MWRSICGQLGGLISDAECPSAAGATILAHNHGLIILSYLYVAVHRVVYERLPAMARLWSELCKWNGVLLWDGQKRSTLSANIFMEVALNYAKNIRIIPFTTSQPSPTAMYHVSSQSYVLSCLMVMLMAQQMTIGWMNEQTNSWLNGWLVENR